MAAPSTRFAPAARADADAIEAWHQRIVQTPFLRAVVDAVPDVVLVLNAQRQIVYANRALSAFLGDPGQGQAGHLLGCRPGEAIRCEHAHREPGGCGTSDFCRTCGAVRAVLDGLRGTETVQDCRITTAEPPRFLDMRVRASPFSIDGETFVVATLLDISHEKRRQALERIFFHDVLNTAGGLRGYVELYARVGADQRAHFADRLLSLTNRLIDEIQTQRELAAAENGELVVRPVELDAAQLCEEVAAQYRGHPVAEDKHIEVRAPQGPVTLVSDPSLLSRVLGNMLKNALEASAREETVQLGCAMAQGRVVFTVHNAAVMPREVQTQVFQRSFSTRGPGRGLGTYSMRLLSERYLEAQVWFESQQGSGTAFSVSCPSVLSAALT